MPVDNYIGFSLSCLRRHGDDDDDDVNVYVNAEISYSWIHYTYSVASYLKPDFPPFLFFSLE